MSKNESICRSPLGRMLANWRWMFTSRCRQDMQLEALINPYARHQLLAIAEITSDWIWLTDHNDRFIYVSPRVFDHVHVRPEVFIGRTRGELRAALGATGLPDIERHVANRLPFNGLQYGWVGENDDEQYVELSGKPLWTKDGSFAGYIGSGRCVTDLIKQQRELSQAHDQLQLRVETDALTGLYNREYFNSRIGELCRDAESSFVLILADLDHFKTINDTYGHRAGDDVLVEFSRRLRSVARTGDIVCRLGGDEFAILAPACENVAAGQSMAARLLDLQRRPIVSGETTLIVSSSIGIHGVNAGCADREVHSLFHKADLALYRAKALGRSKAVCFDAEVESTHKRENELLVELDTAIKSEQIEAVFQPIVDTVSQRVVGVEALARWQRRNGEAVTPIVFIPLAEQHGLISGLGRLILKQAVIASTKICDSIYVSINVSVSQLGSGDFAKQFAELTSEHGAPPERFCLEVTESVCIGENTAILRELSDLQAMGAKVVLDDFGAGHSSLFYLQKFAFAKIKLDRAFLNDVDNDRARAILSAISALAEAMGTPVVAEGVETSHQHHIICSDGISEAQGYLFHRPMPLAKLLPTISSANRERQVAGTAAPDFAAAVAG